MSVGITAPLKIVSSFYTAFRNRSASLLVNVDGRYKQISDSTKSHIFLLPRLEQRNFPQPNHVIMTADSRLNNGVGLPNLISSSIPLFGQFRSQNP